MALHRLTRQPSPTLCHVSLFVLQPSDCVSFPSSSCVTIPQQQLAARSQPAIGTRLEQPNRQSVCPSAGGPPAPPVTLAHRVSETTLRPAPSSPPASIKGSSRPGADTIPVLGLVQLSSDNTAAVSTSSGGALNAPRLQGFGTCYLYDWNDRHCASPAPLSQWPTSSTRHRRATTPLS